MQQIDEITGIGEWGERILLGVVLEGMRIDERACVVYADGWILAQVEREYLRQLVSDARITQRAKLPGPAR
jgi:hypothetical protein